MKRLILLFFLLIIVVTPACREHSKEELFQQGMEFSKARNYKAATSLFRDSLKKDPNYIEARYNLGIAYFETDKLDKAEKEFEKVYLQNPTYSEVHFWLAQIYLATERPKKVLEHFNDEISLENPEALKYLAKAHIMMGDLNVAEELLRKSLSLRPLNSSTGLVLAGILLQTERVAEGQRLVNDIIKHEPNNTDAYFLSFQQSLREGDRIAFKGIFSPSFAQRHLKTEIK